MSKYKRNTNAKRTDEEVLEWYKEHLTGVSCGELSKKYNTDAFYQFRKRGLKPIFPISISRKGKIKIINNFSNISTEEDSYILGFLYSDGYISNFTVGLSLHKKDEEILHKIKTYISPETSILKDKTKNNSLVIKFHSKVMVENLQKIGLLYDKTNKMFGIPNIPSHLKRHFIRGYFDGDGSIFYDRKACRVNICSINKLILEDIQKEFNKFGIENIINTEKREGKMLLSPQGGKKDNYKDMHRVFVRKKYHLLKLYQYFYGGASIFLERKFEIFEKFVKEETGY